MRVAFWMVLSWLIRAYHIMWRGYHLGYTDGPHSDRARYHATKIYEWST